MRESHSFFNIHVHTSTSRIYVHITYIRILHLLCAHSMSSYIIQATLFTTNSILIILFSSYSSPISPRIQLKTDYLAIFLFFTNISTAEPRMHFARLYTGKSSQEIIFYLSLLLHGYLLFYYYLNSDRKQPLLWYFLSYNRAFHFIQI